MKMNALKTMLKQINTGRGAYGYSRVFMLVLFLLCCGGIWATQTGTTNQVKIMVVNGRLVNRDTGNQEAFFGVNYCAPFAHSYRALEKLGKNHKEEISKDVYHFARLGFDGFRIHIWDTEISDSLGNVVNNEHLDLLDYMLWKLKQRNIKIILTPLTFYNNGYPDGATKTDGFANYISKGEATRKEFRPVIERYLSQFINHVNPYTAQTYAGDPDIIAVEIINEPAHSGELGEITDFIDEMAGQLRKSGWEKPVFYNISQNPGVVEAVMNARIDGVAFQWYPAGLVGGAEIKDNYLPFVDVYTIPFSDEPAFKSKVQFVYEFDSADVLNSYVYPAMARSFRKAGFQWATQFAYDPLAIAYANTDYPTHYLNLAYTPSKAVSMLIASMAFHHIPLHKDFGTFPADTIFGDFRLSHSLNLSEMGSDTAFYYSNTTQTYPRNPDHLKHIAGVGSSPLISYEGSGVYFLDKLENGTWRLEVMPDAVLCRDPFARPSLSKHVVNIDWHEHRMKTNLSDLGRVFLIQGLNEGNKRMMMADSGSFAITPGSYLLLRNGKNKKGWAAESRMGPIEIGEFVAPPPSPDIPFVKHVPWQSVEEGKPVQISAVVFGTHIEDKVWLMAGTGWRLRSFAMHEIRPTIFDVQIPEELVNSGMLVYWIVIEQENSKITFPGNHPGSPSDWDYYYKDHWEVLVVDSTSPVELFNTRSDYQQIDYAFSWWNRNYRNRIVPTNTPGQLAVQSAVIEPDETSSVLGWKTDIGDKIAGRKKSLQSFRNLGIKVRSINENPVVLRIILIDHNGGAFTASLLINDTYADYSISIDKFKFDSMMLLPRPFPPFEPIWFRSSEMTVLQFQNIEAVQVLIEPDSGDTAETEGFEVASIWLEQ